LGVAGSFAPAGLPNPAAKPLDRSTEFTMKSGDPAGAEKGFVDHQHSRGTLPDNHGQENSRFYLAS
jgi:hypothetical protein